MDSHERSLAHSVPAELVLAPIQAASAANPLNVCLLLQANPDPAASPFLLLREVPGARVYLGAVCDAAGRVQEWVEIWLQELELRDISFSDHQEPLDNATFDKRWQRDVIRTRNTLPELVIVTGMEEKNPTPLLIHRAGADGKTRLAKVESAPFALCKDDALLESRGLPTYSSSAHRYLLPAAAGKSAKFLASTPDAPTSAHVQTAADALAVTPEQSLFNLHAGLLQVTRFSPLQYEEYLQVLEGRSWEGPLPRTAQVFPGSIYARLQAWAGTPKGLPFLLHTRAQASDRLSEVFYLKVSALIGLFKTVRAYVQAQQLPLLNLSPASFRIFLPEAGEQFPALWLARPVLVKPGQAYLLRIKSTEQKYFVRLGKTEPSPFLPEGLGAHSFGIGSVRVRNVISEREGVVLEGTLVAEDYLGLDAHDMLWFKLPVAEERLEFYAHVHTSEIVGPKEARFRTVPAQHSEAVVASLKRAAGTAFQRSPYEIWPLLSSPCDLFSLGVIATRTLLANSQSHLPVVLDEVLSLSQHFGKDATESDSFLGQLRALLTRDRKVLDLISPTALVESSDTPEQSRASIPMDLWVDAIAVMLRLFPGVGPHSFCRSFGDVTPLALETVFDRPIQELESIQWRLRSVLWPSLSANEEIAGVLLEQLGG